MRPHRHPCQLGDAGEPLELREDIIHCRGLEFFGIHPPVLRTLRMWLAVGVLEEEPSGGDPLVQLGREASPQIDIELQ